MRGLCEPGARARSVDHRRRLWRRAAGLVLAIAVMVAWGASPGWGCACGCGVYEVGTASLFPQGGGGTVWFEYDFMNQYLNWHATHIASAGANDDKVIRTHFLTLGAQYMFNRSWGAMLEVPYWYRYFKTQDDGATERFNFSSIGDIRMMGMYTGLSEDMSTGLLAGVKVPSGWWTYPHADRDTQVGTGSTDLLLGGYQLGAIPRLTFRDRPVNWFGQIYYELPLWSQENYTPGREFDGALGGYYNFGAVGPLMEAAPMLTLIGSDRTRDTGSAANPTGSGYTRLLIAPGAEIRLFGMRLYGDVEVPFFQNIRGNQLISPVLFKTIVSYDF